MINNSFRSNVEYRATSVFSLEFYHFVVYHDFCFYESLFELTEL